MLNFGKLFIKKKNEIKTKKKKNKKKRKPSK
jgi:hypothetical protein